MKAPTRLRRELTGRRCSYSLYALLPSSREHLQSFGFFPNRSDSPDSDLAQNNCSTYKDWISEFPFSANLAVPSTLVSDTASVQSFHLKQLLGCKNSPSISEQPPRVTCSCAASLLHSNYFASSLTPSSSLPQYQVQIVIHTMAPDTEYQPSNGTVKLTLTHRSRPSSAANPVESRAPVKPKATPRHRHLPQVKRGQSQDRVKKNLKRREKNPIKQRPIKQPVQVGPADTKESSYPYEVNGIALPGLENTLIRAANNLRLIGGPFKTRGQILSECASKRITAKRLSWPETKLKSFHKDFIFFQKLPTEMRLKIFRLSFPPAQRIEVGWIFAKSIIPVTLHLNKEAREETLRHYQITEPAPNIANGAMACFSPTRDTFFIDLYSVYGAYTSLDQLWGNITMKHTPDLFNNITTLEIITDDYDRAEILEYLVNDDTRLTLFKNLEHLKMVIFYASSGSYRNAEVCRAILETDHVKKCRTQLFREHLECSNKGNPKQKDLKISIVVRVWPEVTEVQREELVEQRVFECDSDEDDSD